MVEEITEEQMVKMYNKKSSVVAELDVLNIKTLMMMAEMSGKSIEEFSGKCIIRGMYAMLDDLNKTSNL